MKDLHSNSPRVNAKISVYNEETYNLYGILSFFGYIDRIIVEDDRSSNQGI